MVVTKEISVETQGHADIIDITSRVAKCVSESSIPDGAASLFVAHTTAAITTMEFEPGLVSDFKAAWKRLVPEYLEYEHNKQWNDGNGYAHVRASMIGQSLTVPVTNKKLRLGTWQKIVLVDFDNKSRTRQVMVQIIGD